MHPCDSIALTASPGHAITIDRLHGTGQRSRPEAKNEQCDEEEAAKKEIQSFPSHAKHTPMP